MTTIAHAEKQGARTTAANFDNLARFYRWMEWLSFGSSLWRCRCQFLSSLVSRRSALVIGDGDGRFVARLLGVNAQINVHAVDASAAMLLELARRAAPHADRLRVIFADARAYTPVGLNFDAVVTHFFLDCLTTDEVYDLAARLGNRVRKDTIWIISEFEVPSGRLGRVLAAPLVSGLYLAFRWLTGLQVRRLPDHRSALSRAGWSLRREKKRMFGLLVSQQWRISA